MRVSQEQLLSAGDMSQATLTSSVLPLDSVYCTAIQAVYTGAPVGSLKIQANVGGTTWTDISSSTVAVSAASDTLWNISDIGYKSLRVVYTKTSGTGSLNILSFTKGV